MARRNLVPNPSFENSTASSGWQTNAGCDAITRDTTRVAQHGTYYGVTRRTSTTGTIGVIQSAQVAITQGLPYSASAWINRANTSNTVVGLDIDWWSDSAYLSSTQTNATPAQDTWVRLTVNNALPPVGATRARAYLRAENQVAGQYIRFDAVVLEQRASAGSYFDGSFAGCSWDGTANASSSYMSESWAADNTQANSNAAGFNDTPYNRQTAAGDNAASGIAWPVPTAAVPSGRSGRGLRFALPTLSRRYEVEPNHNLFYNGDSYFFGTAFYLESGFPLSSGSYQVIEQMRQQSTTGSPVAAFEVRSGNQLLLTGGYGIDTGTPARLNYTQVLATGITTGTWYNLVYRLSFSTSESTSTIDVWLNGTQVLTNYTIPPATVIGGGTYRKQGLYHDPTYGAAALWHAGQEFGTSYAEVDPGPAVVPKSGSDSATLTESVSGTATVSGDTDSATFTESATYTAALSRTDSASLSESATYAASITRSDTGTFSEQAFVSVVHTSSDSATVVDSLSLNAALSTADSGSLLDSATTTAQVAGSPDTAVLTESGSVIAVVSTTDAISFVDSVVVDKGTYFTRSDSAVFTDSVVVSVTIADQDSATLTDSATINSADSKSVLDSGLFSETASVATSTSGTDNFSVVDSVSVGAQVASSDVVALTDSLVIERKSTTSDSATMTDWVSVSTSYTRTDSANLSDSVSVSVAGSTTDQVSVTDTAALTATTSQSDAFSVSEDFALSAGSALPVDQATFTESTNLAREQADSATFSETITVQVVIAATDTVQLTDSPSITAPFEIADYFVFSESRALSISGVVHPVNGRDMTTDGRARTGTPVPGKKSSSAGIKTTSS